jgi:hypothetical protein
MDINYNNLCSCKEVLADVQMILNDEEANLLTSGFYLAKVRDGLDELSFDISFLPVTVDIPLTVNLHVPMPAGVFDLQSINIFTGTPTDVQYTETVYWRKGVQSLGYNTGSIARINPSNSTDPFNYRSHVGEQSLYYFSVQNGIIRLSDACKSFDYVRLTYNGLPSANLTNIRMIPPEVKEALTLWVTERCAGALKMKDNKYRIIQTDAAIRLDEYGLSGAWHLAQMRLVRLDKKKLLDAVEYNSKMNF